MSYLYYRPNRGPAAQNRSGMHRVTGSFTTTTAGAVDTSDTPGFTVTKTANKTGRYRVQLTNPNGESAVPYCAYSGATVIAPWGIQDINVEICSPTADAALTTGAGVHHVIRNFTPGSGYFDIQFFKSVTAAADDTHADAEVVSGTTILLGFSVKTNSTVP